MTWTIEGSMKCVCGYEYKAIIGESHHSYISDIQIVKGDDEFIKIEGAFHTTVDRYDYKRIEQVSIYACPKCGTLKTDWRE